MRSGRSESRATTITICMTLICGLAIGQTGQVEKSETNDAPTEQAAKARVLWQYAPARCEFEEVVTRDGTVFALDRRGKIHALDAATGEPRWTSTDKESFSYGYGLALSPDPKFDALLVGCDTGFFALDCKTGKKLWHTEIPLGVAAPACTEKAVIAGGADGKVHACELTTGKLLWEQDYLEDAPEDPPGVAGGSARFDGRPARPSAAATDGKMVALSIFDQCRTLAFDVETGKRLWDVSTGGWMSGRPAIDPRYVFVGSQDRHFYAVDKASGKLAWKVKTGGRVSAAGAAGERFLYFGSCDANLYAVDQVVGKIRWKFKTDHEKGYGAPIYSCPLVFGDKVYLAAMSGKVYALQRDTGELVWDLCPLPNSELNSDLVTDGTRLFVTTRKDGDKGQSAVLAIDFQ